MMRTKRQILSVILAIALLALPSTVFAKELGLLTITGPGIKGEFSLNNPDQLMNAGFFDQTDMMSKAPENLGQGYNITAHLNLDGKMTPFITLVYYPTEKGQAGYVNYTGRLDGTTLRTVNEWGRLSLNADNAFRALMTVNNITLQTAVITAPAAVAVAPQTQPEVQPASAPTAASIPIPYIVLALTATVLAALGTVLFVRRRAINQRSAQIIHTS